MRSVARAEADVSQSNSAWLALDIGGAHLKAAHTQARPRTTAFEVWRRPGDLAQAIAELAAGLPDFGRIAVTMTAELCDCFETKSEGVRAILDAVEQTARGRPVSVWGTDGRFHTTREIRNEPLLAAAGNWLALAKVAAASVPADRGLLIDIGSTTTDLIPLDRGEVVARGRTDTERLATGELVYAGVRRTPFCALATELSIGGRDPIGLAAELFATTLDVFLVLGDLEPDEDDLGTADGRSATVDRARDRLARMIGADRDSFSMDDARELAASAERCLLDRLVRASDRVCSWTIGRPECAIVSGSGEFLARRLAARLLGPGCPIHGLARSWGEEASTAACAHALLQLVTGVEVEI